MKLIQRALDSIHERTQLLQTEDDIIPVELDGSIEADFQLK